MAANTYSAEVLIETARSKRSLDEARQSTDNLNKSLTSLYATIRGGQGDLNAMAKTIGSISTTVSQAQKASQDFANAKIAEAKAVAQANKAMDGASAKAAASSSRELAQGIDETASASARLSQNSPAAAMRDSAKASRDFGDSLANQRYLLYDIGATYRTLAIAAQAIPAASVAAASAYERDFAQVMRVTGQTTGMSQDLRKELKQLASEIPLSFSELSNIAQIGGQMNIPSEQLSKFTETVARFVATADGATIDSTTQAFGRMANLFNQGDNFDPEFFNRLGSAISMTADNAVTSEAKIISMLDKLAPVAKQAGLGAEEVTAFASALSSVGLAPEISSGFFTRFFGQLNKDIAAGSDRLSVYADTLGVTVGEFKKMYQSNPSDVLQGIAKAMSSMDKVSATSLLGDLGVKATRDQRVLAGLSESYHVLEQAMTDVDEAYKKATYLEASSAGIFGTFASNLKELGGAVMNLGDSIGAGPLAVLSHLTEKLTVFTQSVSRLLDETPALKFLLGVLLNFGSVIGIMFALKSAMAFITASMVAFQQANRTGLTSTLSLGNSMKTMATTMLAARGASEQATNALLRQASGMQALRIAATTTKATIDQLNGAQLAAGSSAMVVGAQAKRSWSGIGSALLGFAGGPLGVALTSLGLLGTAWFTASQDAKNGAEEVMRAFAQTDAAGAEALASALSREKVSLFSGGTNKFFDDNIGKSFQEVANKIGVSINDISTAMSGGKSAVDAYIASLEKAKAAAPSDQANEYDILIAKLKTYRDELQVADTIAENTAEAQKGLAGATDEAAMSFGAGTDEVKNWASELNNAVAQAFGLIDAQGALAASMEKLGAGLQSSGSFGTDSAGGRDNLANLQATLQAQALVLQQSLQAGEISAQAAADAYGQFAQGLLNEIVNMGGGVSEEVASIVDDTVYAVQSTFNEQAIEIPVTANAEQALTESEAVVQGLQNWISQNILQLPMMLLNGDETAQDASAVVNYISEITGWPQAVVIEALTNPASDNAEAVMKYINQIVDDPKSVAINADASSAIKNIQQFAIYANNQLLSIQEQAAMVAVALPGVTGTIASTALRAAAILSGPAQEVTRANNAAIPSFQGLNRGYDDAAKNAAGAGRAAKKAGDSAKKGAGAAKKAAKDAGKAAKALTKDWDEAEQQISGFAQRVGQAFQYVFAETQGVQSAKDEYYTVLNGITERLNQQKQAVKDLRAENKKLAADRKVELNEAAKLEKMAGYADQMGNTERAKYYRDEAKSLKESAKETQNKINANEKEAKTIEKGMGNLKGYSKEAIENRNELRRLEQASLDVAKAYAASGSSATTVKNKTAEWTGKAKEHSKQLGYNKSDVEKVTTATDAYIKKLGKVPKTINTKINETKTTTLKASNQTKSGTDGARKNIGGVPGSKTTSLNGNPSGIKSGAKTARTEIGKVPGSKTTNFNFKFSAADRKKFQLLSAVSGPPMGGIFLSLSRLYAGGMVGAFNNGGLIPGTPPSNPKKDNILASVDGKGMAAIRSGEYIQSQPAVDYYGQSFMDKINRMELPRYYSGGAVGGRNSSGGNMPSVLELGAETIQSIARLVQKDIYLYADNVQLAQSVHKGNTTIAQQGGAF